MKHPRELEVLVYLSVKSSVVVDDLTFSTKIIGSKIIAKHLEIAL